MYTSLEQVKDEHEHDFMTLSLVLLTRSPASLAHSYRFQLTSSTHGDHLSNYTKVAPTPFMPRRDQMTPLSRPSVPACRRLAKQKWHRLWLLCDFSGTAGRDALPSLSGPTSHMTLSGCEKASDCTNAQLGISQSVINVSPFLTRFAGVTLWHEIVTFFGTNVTKSNIYFSTYIFCLLDLLKTTLSCLNEAETRESEIGRKKTLINEPKKAKSTTHIFTLDMIISVDGNKKSNIFSSCCSVFFGFCLWDCANATC